MGGIVELFARLTLLTAIHEVAGTIENPVILQKFGFSLTKLWVQLLLNYLCPATSQTLDCNSQKTMLRCKLLFSDPFLGFSVFWTLQGLHFQTSEKFCIVLSGMHFFVLHLSKMLFVFLRKMRRK